MRLQRYRDQENLACDKDSIPSTIKTKIAMTCFPENYNGRRQLLYKALIC